MQVMDERNNFKEENFNRLVGPAEGEAPENDPSTSGRGMENGGRGGRAPGRGRG
jgi:hypothetical protein